MMDVSRGRIRFSDRVFTKPTALQAGSPLLRLTPELRLKILRNLMRNTHVLGAKYEIQRVSSNDYAKEYAAETQLSSQVLACCQQLYTEGLGVLYGENTAEVVCGYSLRGDTMCCEALDGCLPIPDTVADIEIGEQDLFHLTKEAKGSHLYRGYDTLDGDDAVGPGRSIGKWACFNQSLPALFNFRSLYLALRAERLEEFFVVCRTLQGLVRGKAVEGSIISLSGKAVGDFVRCCDLWECSTFDMDIPQDTDVDETASLDSTDESDIEMDDDGEANLNGDLKSSLDIDDEFRDTLQMWKDLDPLHTALADGLRIQEVNNRGSMSCHVTYNKLEQAVFTYDYHSALSGLLDMLDHEKADISEPIKNTRDCIDQLRTTRNFGEPSRPRA